MKDPMDFDYEDMWLRYRVTEEPEYKEVNEKNYEKLKALMEEVGVYLDLRDGRLSISVFPNAYRSKRTRNAGRTRRAAFKDDEAFFEAYRYSDIVQLSQSMGDRELMEMLSMPQATFYRHKKALKESRYYKNLDKTRLNDREYLKSVEGDNIF